MAGYCKSCYRDLPSDDVRCPRCISAASKSSPIVGVLLFAIVMAGLLTFDRRLTIIGGALAIVLIVVEIARRR